MDESMLADRASGIDPGLQPHSAAARWCECCGPHHLSRVTAVVEIRLGRRPPCIAAAMVPRIGNDWSQIPTAEITDFRLRYGSVAADAGT